MLCPAMLICTFFSASVTVWPGRLRTISGAPVALFPLKLRFCRETLTAESVDEVHALLLQVPVNSPVVMIERLACDFASPPLEGRRSFGHAELFRYSVDIR